MVSEVSICNMALTRIGQSRISSLSQTGVLAELSNLYYEPTLNELLSAYEWPFAIRRVQLSASALDNLTAYTNMYQLPLTALRVLTMVSSEDYSDISDKWEIEDDKFFTDTSPCFIKYISTILNPTKLPQPFVEALYLRIASKMVLKITQDQSMMQGIFQEYTTAFQSAITVIGGNSQSAPKDTEWWSA